MARRPHLRLLCLAIFACACSGPALEPATTNPMLERWCDSHPCGWDVTGEFKRVGTWHPDDYAIQLMSDDASLSQLRAELNSSLAECFAFSMMAYVEDGARATLELDFLDDGELEFAEPIPESHWEVRTFTITTPTWYDGVRFIVRRTGGSGEVIVAELNVELRANPCAPTPLTLLHRPAGASCMNEAECESGSCTQQLSGGGTCD